MRRATVLNLLPLQLVFPAYTCSHKKYQTILPSYPCWRGFPWPGGPCSFLCWPRSVGWCGRRTRRRCRQPWRGWPETRRSKSRSTSTSYRRGPPGIKWRDVQLLYKRKITPGLMYKSSIDMVFVNTEFIGLVKTSNLMFAELTVAKIECVKLFLWFFLLT